MNYYEHHLGDYAKDTAHLTMLEHGAYRLLLDRYYGTEQGIPADQAHRLARARTKEEKQAVDDVLAEFFQLVDGAWMNKRADEEIAKAQVKINAAKENGKKGGRPKKDKPGSENETHKKPTGLFAGSENETQEKAHQTPDTRHQLKPSEQPPLCTQPESREPHSDVAAIPDPPTNEGHWLTWFNREAATSFDAGSRFDREGLWPTFRRWCDAGVTQQQMRDAVQRAFETATEPIACLPKYVDRVLANGQRPDPKPSPGQKTAAAAARWLASQGVEP